MISRTSSCRSTCHPPDPVPLMDTDPRLPWVKANRAREDSGRRVGPVLVRVLESLAVAGAERLDAVVERLDGAVDEEFRRHCRIGFLDAATLMIQVDSASLVYAMRARWLSRVQQTAAELRTSPRIRRIVFAEGRDGVRLKPRETANHDGAIVGDDGASKRTSD